MIIYTAALNGTSPAAARLCKMPTDADELWMIAVTSAPARIPRNGLCPSFTKMLQNASDSWSGATADDIVVIPTKRIPNPTIMLEISFDERLLPVSMMITPIIIAIGARLAGLKNFAHSTLDTSQPVTVVPIFAPMMTPIAWDRFMIPAFTNPTTITVVADELWITAVINAPSITPKSLFFVSASNRDFILLPAAFSKPCAMICIP